MPASTGRPNEKLQVCVCGVSEEPMIEDGSWEPKPLSEGALCPSSRFGSNPRNQAGKLLDPGVAISWDQG